MQWGRELTPWVLLSLAVLLGIATYLWVTAPPVNTLPDDYGVM